MVQVEMTVLGSKLIHTSLGQCELQGFGVGCYSPIFGEEG